jgi:hypothetical protein
MTSIQPVQPGQVISSGAWNSLVIQINDLLQRVTDLEAGGGGGGGTVVAITGFTPANQVPAGQVLAILGANFAFPPTNNLVTVDGVPVGAFQAASTSTRLEFIVPLLPAIPPSGKNVAIVVSNPAGNDQKMYRIMPAIPVVGLPPTMTKVTKSSNASNTLEVLKEATIDGTDFSTTLAENLIRLRVPIGGGAFVDYPKPPATNVPMVSATATQIKFTVPDITEIAAGTQRPIVLELSVGAHPPVTRTVPIERP